jgi:hypothetical protein
VSAIATLAAIDAALFTALGTLVHTGTATAQRPFARAVRGWAPIDASLLTLAPQSPAVILVWGRTKPQLVQASDTILGTPQPESRSPETWTIYVVHGETRDVDVALHGETAAPGVLPLVDAVLGTVQGLAVAGTWQGRRVRVADYGPHGALSQRGSVYVADVVVVAERATPHVTDAAPDGATPLDEIQGDNGPPGELFDHGTADTSP